MAVIDLSVNVPGPQVARLQAACRSNFGQVSDGAGGFRDMTNQEIVDRLRSLTKKMLIDIVRGAEITAARAAADTSVVDLDAT